MNKQIATVINFCSNDYPFFEHCIKSAAAFSDQIVVPICDHFFDGTPENISLLQNVFAQYPKVSFVQFPFDQESLQLRAHQPWFWHNMARLVGWSLLKPEIDYVLFLDCDEVIDVTSFSEWLEQFQYRDFNALMLSNYWYFREPCYQARKWEDTAVFAKKEKIHGKTLLSGLERLGIYNGVTGKKKRGMKGMDGKPMIHHYSWVRTKEQMLKKVRSWSHRTDRNWEMLVEEEFSNPFSGRDFVHGYRFKTVEPAISLSLAPSSITAPKDHHKNVHVLTPHDVKRLELFVTFDIPLK